MNPKNAYLLCYNATQLALWSSVLYHLTTALLHPPATPSEMYATSSMPALRAQTLAWLEVPHAALGLAGGGAGTAFIQCLGRYVLLAFVIARVPFVPAMWVTIALLAAWAIGDVVRYAFYIWGILGLPQSRLLLWMRYSLFYLLYPVGIVGEWLIYYYTLGYVDENSLYAVRLPNAWNFAFDFGTWNRVVLVIYFYFGPFMFMHMVRQRQKKLARS